MEASDERVGYCKQGVRRIDTNEDMRMLQAGGSNFFHIPYSASDATLKVGFNKASLRIIDTTSVWNGDYGEERNKQKSQRAARTRIPRPKQKAPAIKSWTTPSQFQLQKKKKKKSAWPLHTSKKNFWKNYNRHAINLVGGFVEMAGDIISREFIIVSPFALGTKKDGEEGWISEFRTKKNY